ncbi:unnamed protein product [Aspergillus oryzae var. brunneus]|uniref:Unnamed protein product n=1 Tax=Aspergillus oryzae var. brunneus TaxID=332754 RepID=A0ABQ6L4I3_ASPOZ|nr:unnamed protein product [Aspergillus oryzae var. brunneus]
MEGHSSPSAAADVPAQAGEGPAPVQADIRSHAVHHDQGALPERESSPARRITPRPTFLENLASTRDSQFMLDRRNSSEIDRYFTSRNLARTIWVNTKEREGELGKEDLLQKLYVGIRCKRPQLYTIFSDNTRTAMNLILAFAVALKHKLRFEPDIAYDDLAGLVGYLDTFAKDAHDRQRLQPQRKSLWKSTGEYLGVSFAESNPRKLVKRSKKPLGHLPLEILNHLSAYIDRCIANDTLNISLHQAQASMCHPGICDAIVTIDTNLNSSQRPRYPERSRHGN